jgi:peptidoglycan/LPS O-acetylase OafA/YrhL
MILGVAMAGLMRKRGLVMPLLALGCLAGCTWLWLDPAGFRSSLHSSILLPNAVRLGLMFSIGSSLYLWADKVPVSVGWACIAGVVFVASSALPDWRLIGALPFAYALMVLSVRLPFSRVGRRTDLSYGIYLYGWPVLQLLTVFRLNKVSYPLYLLAGIALSAALAWVSWTLVEKPALALKGRGGVLAWLSRANVGRADPVAEVAAATSASSA